MATIIRSNIIKRYKVSNESTAVSISAAIGYGHASGSIVKIDSIEIFDSNSSNWTKEAGLCKDLKGKKLECIVSVRDLQPNPNTGIDWLVSGCGTTVLSIADNYPGANGDLIIYNLTVYFN